MITLSVAAEILHGSAPTPHPDVTRVIQVAHFFRIRHNEDGSETHYWELDKPIGVYPAGTVMPLALLHSLLFP